MQFEVDVKKDHASLWFNLEFARIEQLNLVSMSISSRSLVKVRWNKEAFPMF